MSVLSFALAASLLAMPAVGVVQDTLERVSVSGSRIPLALGQSARIVTILDSYEIASIPAGTVNDLLKNAVGVDVRQRGALGTQTDVSLRGGTFDQIAVLLDGVNISDPHTGHNAFDFPIDVSQIERIEIIEGPAARSFGTASLLGAINIVTRSHASRPEAGFHLGGGSFGLFDVGASGAFQKGSLYQSLSASHSRTDGFSTCAAGTPNTDSRQTKGFYRGAYSKGLLNLDWHLGVSARDYGSSTFYSPKFDNQFESTLKTFSSLRASVEAGRVRILPSVYWTRSNDRFELLRDDPETVPFNYHRTNVQGANLGFRSKTLAWGAELRREAIVSTNLGEPLEQPFGKYKMGLTRYDISAYAEHSVVRSLYTYSLGLVMHKNTGNDEKPAIYPGADFSLRLSDSWKLYASYNSSYRMPTFTELYYSVGGHKADSQLKAEKMQAAEMGVKYLAGGVRAIATLWYHNGRDMIDWVRPLSDPGQPWESVNHARVNSLGEELTLRFEPAVIFNRPSLPLRLFELSYSHISQRKDSEEGIESYYALEYLRNKAVARTDFLFFGRLGLDVCCRWMDRASSSEENAYSPYFLLDAKLSCIFSRLKLTLSAENLTDTQWFDHKYVPQPGRWMKLGLEVKF